jgi:amino acid adenylation domain-containing protein
MVPSFFTVLPELPLTPSGKIDRKALLAVQPESAVDEPAAPLTPVEELVAGIFAGVLGLERVDPGASFFALGGHSLLATQAVARVRQVLGVELPLRALFMAPTVSGLAAEITTAQAGGPPPVAPLARRERPAAPPLSFAQERLWFLQQLDPGSAAYNMPVAVELSGELDVSALAAALAEIVRRHESLRTTFPAAGDVPRQRIAPPAPPAVLPLVDLSALPVPAGRAEAERLDREHAGEPLDLERGPLVRALLVRLAAQSHRFSLNLHHILADGWSLGVLVRELGALYGAGVEGRPSPLPELPIQYADFAVWQREELAGTLEAELAYWESRLGGENAGAEIPTDRPRPAVPAFRGGRLQAVLPPDLVLRLKRFGHAEGVTLFMTLLAATATLLSRHGGETDVSVGAPVAGRRWSETEGLIGCFLNTLVLRTDLSGAPSLRRLAAQVRQVTLEAYSHQDVPFEAVLARLRPERDLSRAPLFQVLLNMLNLPAADGSLPGLGLRVLTPAEVPSKLDMTLYVSEAESGVRINLVYNADLFAGARMAELLAQLEILLEAAVARPEDPLESFALVTPAARALLPDPAAALAEPPFPPIARLFLDCAAAHSAETALRWRAGAWTYAQLAARAGEIARSAAAAGAGPGTVVAVTGPRCPELVASLLGVFLSGGALLLLDPKLPAARVRVMVEDARPVCLIDPEAAGEEGGWRQELEALPILAVPPAAAGGTEPGEGPGMHAAPDDPAYVFFTSGTTGRPKAVLGRHKGLSHFLTWQREEFGIGPGDRAAQLTGLSFDVVLRDILVPLTSGATLDLPAEEDFDPARILSWIQERGITMLHTVPTLAGAWLSAAPPELRVESLRWTFFAGEPLLDQVVERWRAAFPRTAVVNLYGPTETTLAKCFYRVPDPPARPVQPVGSPLPQTQALILAGERRCGLGEVGEIVVRTPFRSLGYLNNPEESRLRFRPNPFTGDAGDLLYYTGDRGRFRLDGSVEILGRLDEQVKIRGVRVELAEIRAALGRHPGVGESAVLLHRPADHRPGGERLVAFLVLRPAAVLDREALRRQLRQELPEAMVPSSFVVLDALPVTPNGKVDRRALERLVPEAEREAADRTAPRTPTEELVAGIFARVLGLERVGVEENFFELGGHSLLATQVASRVKAVLGVELPLRTLFAAPTVAGLAAELERSAGETGTPPLVRADRSGELPLSFAQQRLWFLEQLQPGSPAYNMPVALRLRGKLSVPALRASLSEVVRRHEALRTVFGLSAGQPIQRILPPAAVPLGVVDLMALDPREREGELSRLLREYAGLPFDLTRGPLLRGVLVRLGEAEHAVLLNQHHIVTDGWSVGVLVREVIALYGAFVAGRPSPLPELAIQYVDFAIWQRSWLAGAVLERQVSYWRERLATLPALLELPTDHPRPAFRTGRGSRIPVHLPAARLHDLKDLGRSEGATDFMLVLALLHILLSRLSGQKELAVGTAIASRNHAELEPLIGFFANTLVLRGDLSGRPSLREALSRTRETALEAYAHQDLPFEQLVETLQPARATSYSPLFQVMLALQNAPREAFSLPELEAVAIEGSDRTGGTRFDLALRLMESPLGLVGSLEYATDLFDATTISRLVGQLVTLVSEAVAAPSRLVSELALLSSVERHQILQEWNDTRAAFPEETLLHQFFEATAERAPAAIAAVCSGRELTYGELAARSNRLAHLLRRAGVERGAPIGVWVERGFDMLIAVLGVLKAGGYYVALDAAWPAGRVESILATTGAPAIVAGSGLLAAVEEMRWRLPALSDVVCLAIAEPEPPAETLAPEDVRELWDFVAARAVDRVTAGGFISAFTGLPFSEAEVDEYRNHVLSLARPWLHAEARVLEIGNGSGLLLWEMASRVAHVTGVDPSPLTQERNRAQAAQEGLTNVELLTGFAHELDDLVGGEERFDLVLLASTVQFFPGPRYLEQVVRWAFRRLAPGGAILIADVLDARRRDELLATIMEHRRQAGEDGTAVARRQELYLDEALFRDFGTALPEAVDVAVHHRGEGFPNELGWRYDVLFTRGAADAKPPHGKRLKRLWTGWHVDRLPAERLAEVSTPDDFAYVIHTSGSTGEPKGIFVQHRPAANLVDWINRSFMVGAQDRGLFITSLCFDLSVYDIFGLLAVGGTVHVATEEELGDPERLVDLLRTGGITLWDSAPAALVRLAPLFPAELEVGSRLRLVMLSGDWIPVTLPDRVRQAFPGAQVMALGGATEATVWSNWFPVRVVDPRWPSIPYGRPISNARYHVLDAAFAACPIGIPGDLYIGGDCLCTGYGGRPDLTSAAFMPDPFAGRPGARIYRTGDRARYDAAGILEFLGRLDQQVKVRGYRIELGEIEVTLARHPGVREAVVLVREDRPGDQRLVAYVVPSTAAEPTAASLRDALLQSLPEYMVPTAFVILPELPVTANGKLDRRALPAPQWSSHSEPSAARTPTEEIIAEIWCEVLGLAQIGSESFFTLGGHSLSGSQMISRLRQALQVDLPLRALFAAPTVAGLAAEVERLRGPDGAPQRPAIASFRQDRSSAPPLSFAQERFWAGRQAEARSGFPSTILTVVRLEGELDPYCLRRALQEIVDRHESLRTSFAEGPAGPVQVVHATLPVRLPVVDLEPLAVPERMAEARRLSIRDGLTPFDYERAPLFRLTLFRFSARESVLTLTVHHVAYDGWSQSVLAGELSALYSAFRAGRPSPLAPLAAQYQDFARWQRRTLTGEVLESQVRFWRQHLDGAVSLDLRGGRPRQPGQVGKLGSEAVLVPEDLERQLEAFIAKQGVTLFMTLLAAFYAMLHLETGGDDIVIICLFANRNQAEIEGLIGNFYAGLPLRVRLAGAVTFRELLERVREVTLAAHENPDILYERVFEGMSFQDKEDEGGLNTFRILFQLVKLPSLGQPPSPDDLRITRLPFAKDTMRKDLSLFLTQADRLVGRFNYNRDVLDPQRAAGMRDRLLRILAVAVADPDRPLAELPAAAEGGHDE